MIKMLVVAARDYKAAVRTKSFIITLTLMPVLMIGSGVVQGVMRKQTNTKDKKFVVVDRTPGHKIFPALQKHAEERNAKEIFEGEGENRKQTRARFILEQEKLDPETPQAVQDLRLQLSQRVRNDEIWGFVEIGPAALARILPGSSTPPPEGRYLRYQTNHPTYEEFPTWLQIRGLMIINSLQSGLAVEEIEKFQPLLLRREGLSEIDPKTGAITDPPVIHQLARFVVPGVLVALMFMIIMLSSTPGMQGVVEEKMQRIAEVLLGSLPPFQLMLGKLIGLMGVSLTIAAVYLGGGFWAAMHYDVLEFLSAPVIIWYLIFQVLAVFMYGSIFLAIGSAATDIKETQTLVMPVMLIACIPMFILSTALEDPNHPLVMAVSFFPPSTPMIMMARIAISPGPPLWQSLVSVALVLAVTLACVYAAGRIFRVGILMQGKSAKMRQLLQWVLRG
jgi:ABC-2 type transport system permease protein